MNTFNATDLGCKPLKLVSPLCNHQCTCNGCETVLFCLFQPVVAICESIFEGKHSIYLSLNLYVLVYVKNGSIARYLGLHLISSKPISRKTLAFSHSTTDNIRFYSLKKA